MFAAAADRAVVRRSPPLLALAGAAMLAALAIQLAAFAPGIMTWDAVRQYGEALNGRYDDWHPPAMDWLWRQLTWIEPGPAPIFAVQLGLYWIGQAGLSGWAWVRGRSWLAVALAVAAALPIPLAIMGAVLKDCLMAGALLTAAALLAWAPPRGRTWLRAAGIALIVAAATLRFNALPACLPLAFMLLPASWRAGRRRIAAALVLLAAIIAAALPLANRLLRAEPSGVELSLVIYDLGGITYYSGADVFPDLDVQDRVARNRRCYTDVKWDTYAWWSPTPCPMQFEDIRDAFADPDQPENPYAHWAKAIAAHPIAYAEHRLDHFNVNTRFLIHANPEAAAQIEGAPNPWGYHLDPNEARTALYAAAKWTGETPLGWPIWWMALAAGALMLAPALPSRRVAVPLALSALLYGLGYLPVSVASEIRYHLWTMIGAGIAALIVASDLASAGLPGRRRLALAAAPLAVVTILATAWRLA